MTKLARGETNGIEIHSMIHAIALCHQKAAGTGDEVFSETVIIAHFGGNDSRMTTALRKVAARIVGSSMVLRAMLDQVK
jgi:hypothetical protein